MEKETVIKVSNLSKRYRIGLKEEMHDSLASSITAFLKAPLKSFKKLKNLSNTNATSDDVFYALKDINFEVKKGEVLGIVGMNGAGKSTLLKVLSRITEPSTGEIELKGRVASLLEVGTGFHPDLTGRENIFLNGTILGMTKKEIIEKMEEIIEFSGVRKFIDTPVKRYSSGMRVRLAFSVAANLDPEILIIDEVLAVGDYEFQSKCLGKMQDVARGGKTILFVSHNMAAVNQLCTRAILLKKGEKIADGTVSEIIAAYKSNNSSGSNSKGITVLEPSSDLTFQLLKIALKNKDGEISDHYEHEEHIKVEIDFRISKQLPNYYLNFNITNVEEIVVYVATDEELSESYHAGTLLPGDYQYSFELPKSLLKPGKYNVNLYFCNQFYPQIQTCADILSFEIIDTTTTRGRKQLYRRDAVVAPDIEWSFRKI
jgi:lipopolysaccharide transport system ATP-binding protein